MGRKKGSQNKITKALKDMILGALDDAGGQKYLAAMAIEEPAAFMTLIGKVLPTTLANAPGEALALEVRRIELVAVEARPAGS